MLPSSGYDGAGAAKIFPERVERRATMVVKLTKIEREKNRIDRVKRITLSV
jgi:hypothetical protein